jgi:hypothetical protein
MDTIVDFVSLETSSLVTTKYATVCIISIHTSLRVIKRGRENYILKYEGNTEAETNPIVGLCSQFISLIRNGSIWTVLK